MQPSSKLRHTSHVVRPGARPPILASLHNAARYTNLPPTAPSTTTFTPGMTERRAAVRNGHGGALTLDSSPAQRLVLQNAPDKYEKKHSPINYGSHQPLQKRPLMLKSIHSLPVLHGWPKKAGYFIPVKLARQRRFQLHMLAQIIWTSSSYHSTLKSERPGW